MKSIATSIALGAWLMLGSACDNGPPSSRYPPGGSYGDSRGGDGAAGDATGGDEQGGDATPGCTTQLEFQQTASTMADLLFVVADGPSMAQEQGSLSAAATDLLAVLTDAAVDFHIGVVSADPADGGVLHVGGSGPAVVTPSTPDAASVLAANLLVGVSGSTRIEAFASAALALGRGGDWRPGAPEIPPNPGFLRRGLCAGTCDGTSTTCAVDQDCPDAPLTLVFVGDGDDQSFGPVRYYARLFESLRRPGDDGHVAHAAVIGPPPAGCVHAVRGAAGAGDRFAELVARAGGEAWSICDDLSHTMPAIGRLATRQQARFSLDVAPDLAAVIPCGALVPGPFCVRVGAQPTDRYQFAASTNEIVFEAADVPAVGAVITIAHAPCGIACTAGSCWNGWFCNSLQNCQREPTCRDNQDCETGELCHTAALPSSSCIPASDCGASVHCPLGQYCSAATFTCTSGCRSTGDCPLREVCVAEACVPAGTVSDCALCPASPMPDASYCDFGEVCGAFGQCAAHAAATDLCATCDAIHPCAASLVCLADDTGGTYCAATCQGEADCPNGYRACAPLQIVTGPCNTGGGGPCDCTDTGTCPNGGRCVGSGSRAYCECVAQQDCDLLAGFCLFNTCLTGGSTPCVVDRDCACDDHRCVVGGFPCQTAADCDLSCVQVPAANGTVGQCLTTAQVCGKDGEVSCTELTTGVAECRAP